MMRDKEQTFGGTDNDRATSVQQTTDSGYVLAGYTGSYAAGYGGFWLISVKGEPTKTPVESTGFPVPVPGINVLGLLLGLILSAVLATLRKKNNK